MMADNLPIAENVQALIDKLHFEGVKAANEEAEQIVRRAKEGAAKITEAAQKEAEHIRSEAKVYIEKEKNATEAAFKTSLRDTVLTLKTQLSLQFKSQLQKLISDKMREERFLEELLLAIGKAAVDNKEQEMKIVIGKIEDFEVKRDHFIQTVTTKMLQNGIEVGTDREKGIKIVLQNQEIEIDLSEEALTELIYDLIIPRYRELFEGITST